MSIAKAGDSCADTASRIPMSLRIVMPFDAVPATKAVIARRLRRVAGFLLGLAVAVSAAGGAPRAAGLPSRLSDRDFWQLVTDFSEPNGYFRSDTLTSNELGFQRVIPDLLARARPGRVYIGVGPEQNFTYIAALRPALAIIIDVRRGNLLLHLMYKALFELAKDRAEFVSLLFSKPVPEGPGAQSTVADLFAAFGHSPASRALSTRTLKAIDDRLTKTHGFPLSAEDLRGIEYVHSSFYARGFAVRPLPTYADLMTATDDVGVSRGYLASESGFAFLKELESNNLVVPAVGDFGGPKAIRAAGAYLKSHGATVSAFYLSNVEQYLHQDGKWAAFCRSVATLPLDESSAFIRTSNRGGGGFASGFGGGFVSGLGQMVVEVKSCH
jgi:hypothetical protein